MKFVISNELNNIRLDKALSSLVKDKSRTYLAKLIDDGNVLVNGKSVKVYW